LGTGWKASFKISSHDSFVPRGGIMPISFCKVTTCFFLVAVAAMAQVDRASLNGTVTDSSGALVPRALVALTGTATGFHREVATGSAGTYSFTALPVGNYTVRVTAPGMKTVEFQNVKLEVGENRTLDAQLQVGELTNVVHVEATAAPIDRSSAEFGGVIELHQVSEIPLDGREWAGLMSLVPGAVDVGGGHERSIHFIGHSRDDNNFTMDGIDASGVQEGTAEGQRSSAGQSGFGRRIPRQCG
jgi:hypothetical protein